MGRRTFLINLLLLAAVALCGQQLVSAWQEFEQDRNVNALLRTTEPAAEEIEALQGPQEIRAPFPEFMVVYERNLFNPERRPEEEAQETEEVPQAPQFKKRPQMTGLASVGGERKALLTVFRNDGSADQRMVGVGDMVEGYVVNEVRDTNVILRWNDHTEVIDMMESEPPKQAAAASKAQAGVNIITVGSAAPAVEASSSSESDQADEERGLQVSSVGGNNQTSRGGLADARGRGAAGNRSGATGAGASRLNNRGGLPANVGIPPRAQQRTNRTPD